MSCLNWTKIKCLKHSGSNLQVTGHRPHITGRRSQVTGCKSQVAGQYLNRVVIGMSTYDRKSKNLDPILKRICIQNDTPFYKFSVIERIISHDNCTIAYLAVRSLRYFLYFRNIIPHSTKWKWIPCLRTGVPNLYKYCVYRTRLLQNQHQFHSFHGNSMVQTFSQISEHSSADIMLVKKSQLRS